MLAYVHARSGFPLVLRLRPTHTSPTRRDTRKRPWIYYTLGCISKEDSVGTTSDFRLLIALTLCSQELKMHRGFSPKPPWPTRLHSACRLPFTLIMGVASIRRMHAEWCSDLL